VDLSAGSGFRVRVADGQLFLGTRTTGITITKDEEVIITGKKITQRVWRPRAELNGRDRARLNELTAKKQAALAKAAQEFINSGQQVPKDLQPNSADFSAEESSEMGQLSDDATSTPDKITDNGTSITVQPDQITLLCGESILQQAVNVVTANSARIPQTRSTVSAVRNDLQTKSGIKGLGEGDV
jgi:hypothetical protein